MKQLIDFKEKYAQNKGFKSWQGFVAGMIESVKDAHLTLDDHLSKVAELFANATLQEGRNEGFTKGCELQKVVCAEHANVLISNSNWNSNLKQLGYIDRDGSHYEVNKDSILNAPDAVNPFKNNK